MKLDSPLSDEIMSHFRTLIDIRESSIYDDDDDHENIIQINLNFKNRICIESVLCCNLLHFYFILSIRSIPYCSNFFKR